jgi:hypothetical protein
MQNLVSIGLLLSLLLGCSRSPSPQKSVKALKTIQSWTATARLVGEAWQQGRVPQHYAQQTLEKSQEEIAKEAKDLTAPPPLIKGVQQTIAQMGKQVDRSQAGAFAAALTQLTTQQQQLDEVTRAQEVNR